MHTLRINNKTFKWKLSEAVDYGEDKYLRYCSWIVDGQEGPNLHRTLTIEELLALRQGELIEVGSHTVSHPFIFALPESVQQDVIQRGKNILEERIGQPVRSFAYPYGNYSKETVEIVRESGFDRACSIIKDSVWHGSDLFQLPRISVEDWNGEKFGKRLLHH